LKETLNPVAPTQKLQIGKEREATLKKNQIVYIRKVKKLLKYGMSQAEKVLGMSTEMEKEGLTSNHK
jgi:cell division ATPase FtsA